MSSLVPTGPPTYSIYPVTTVPSDGLLSSLPFRKTSSLSRHHRQSASPNPLALPRFLLQPKDDISLSRPPQHRPPTTAPPVSKRDPEPPKDLHHIRQSHSLLGWAKEPLTLAGWSQTLHRTQLDASIPQPLRIPVSLMSALSLFQFFHWWCSTSNLSTMWANVIHYAISTPY